MRQVEAETESALSLRKAQRVLLTTAVTSKDFAKVPVLPYADAPAGDMGFPVTAEMEAKLRGAYDDSATALVGDDQISIQQQLNTLEALRRAETTRRQGRREMLAHLAFELDQAAKHDAATLLVFTGMDKATAT